MREIADYARSVQWFFFCKMWGHRFCYWKQTTAPEISSCIKCMLLINPFYREQYSALAATCMVGEGKVQLSSGACHSSLLTTQPASLACLHLATRSTLRISPAHPLPAGQRLKHCKITLDLTGVPGATLLPGSFRSNGTSSRKGEESCFPVHHSIPTWFPGGESSAPWTPTGWVFQRKRHWPGPVCAPGSAAGSGCTESSWEGWRLPLSHSCPTTTGALGMEDINKERIWERLKRAGTGYIKQHGCLMSGARIWHLEFKRT